MKTATILFALLAFICGQSSAAEKPNILILVSDDQGYADVGFNGGKDVPTPYLDKLAAFGVRCTIGYVTYPVCSPSHCIPTLMTPTSCNSSTAADQFGELSKKVLSRPAIVIAQ